MINNTTSAWYESRERSIDGYRYHNDAWLCFGSVRSNCYGIYITDVKISDSPKRDISFRSVPGRSGDLLMDNNRWNNIDITYSLAIATDFSRKFDAFKKALLSKNGYQKLTDSIDTNHFRFGIIKDPIHPKTMRLNRTGMFDVTFHCQPQRYLASGRFSSMYTEPGEMTCSGFPAKPLITVYGNGAGSITVGDTTVKILDMTDQIVLDCDLQHAYRQVGNGAPENMNSNIYAPEFPVLKTGKNPISWSGGVTSIEIIPRWWTL